MAIFDPSVTARLAELHNPFESHALQPGDGRLFCGKCLESQSALAREERDVILRHTELARIGDERDAQIRNRYHTVERRSETSRRFTPLSRSAATIASTNCAVSAAVSRSTISALR